MRFAILLLTLLLPLQAQLVLRQTQTTRQTVGEKGMEASTVLEVFGPKDKLIYTLKVEGVDGRVFHDELYVISRGLEDVEWWSVYRLADGKPLFDTHVPVVRAGNHYAGVDVPADGDARLKNPRLIAVVAIANEAGAVRRIELLAEDAARARLLRSYWDVRRKLTVENDVLVYTVDGVVHRLPLV